LPFTKCSGTSGLLVGGQVIQFSENQALAVSLTDVLAWSHKKVVLHFNKMQGTIGGQGQLHVDFDPSIHSKENTTVFIVYSWWFGRAGLLPLQVIHTQQTSLCRLVVLLVLLVTVTNADLL
jgi:hypothetical protein